MYLLESHHIDKTGKLLKAGYLVYFAGVPRNISLSASTSWAQKYQLHLTRGWPAGPIDNVLLEHGCIHPFTDCLKVLSHYSCWVKYLSQISFGLQNLNWPFTEKFCQLFC